MKQTAHKLILSLTATILAAGGARAYDVSLSTNLPPIDFHGFASQGFLDSSTYNYLGDTTHGSFLFTEAGVNASLNPFPRTRITAQAFTYDMGQDVGKYDVVLDYASVEYTINDQFGVRAGRIRRPEGIYNSIQDVDLARTFVLLPQGVYDARWRDFYVSMDGGEVFGDISLGKSGDLSYDAFGGVFRPQVDGGLGKKIGNQVPSFVKLDSFGADPQSGLQLWWNTPVNGFRVGATGGYNFDLNFDTTAFGQTSLNHFTVPFVQGSVEYLWKSWTFQSEYFTYWVDPANGGSDHDDAWYADVAYRFNKKVEVGIYYSENDNDVNQRANPSQYQKDVALAVRFDPTSWWIFKVEGHCIHGTGLVDQSSNEPNLNSGKPWYMLAVKTTISF